jgi:hypothetical protein
VVRVPVVALGADSVFFAPPEHKAQIEYPQDKHQQRSLLGAFEFKFFWLLPGLLQLELQ